MCVRHCFGDKDIRAMRKMMPIKIDFLKNPLVIFILISCLSGVMAVNLARNPHAHIVYFILAIFIGVAIFDNPKLGIWFMFLSIFVFRKYIITYGELPRQLAWAPEFVLAVLSAKVMLIGIMRERFLKTSITIPVLLLVLTLIVSSVVNGNSLITTLLGLRLYLRYILLFFLLIHLDFDEAFYRTITKFLLVLVYIQIPLAIIFKFWAHISRDMAGGTLTSNEGGFLALFAIFIMLGLILYMKRHIFLHALGLTALLLLPYLAESVGTFLFLPITLFFLFRTMLIKNIVRSSFSIIILIIFYILVLQVFPESNSVTRKLGVWLPSPLTTYQLQMKSRYVPLYSRMGPVENSLRSIYKRPGNAIFGKGPGAATDSYFSTYSGKFFQAEEAGRVQLSISLFEIGLFGVFLYFLIIYKIFKMNRAFRTDDDYWKSIAFGFEGLIFLFVVGTVYMPIWTSNLISFVFWLMASAIYSVSQGTSCNSRDQNMISER